MPIIFHRGLLSPLLKPSQREPAAPPTDHKTALGKGLSRAAHVVGLPTWRRRSDTTERATAVSAQPTSGAMAPRQPASALLAARSTIAPGRGAEFEPDSIRAAPRASERKSADTLLAPHPASGARARSSAASVAAQAPSSERRPSSDAERAVSVGSEDERFLTLERQIARLRRNPSLVADFETNLADVERVYQRTRPEATSPSDAQSGADPVRELLGVCEGTVMQHAATSRSGKVATALCPRLRILDRSDGSPLVLESFDLAGGEENEQWPDKPSTVFAVNGNNDEGTVIELAEKLRAYENVTIVVSGFGGYGIKAGYAVQTERTEADTLGDLLMDHGVKARILRERFATHSNQNAHNVGTLLKRHGIDAELLVCCGTPDAVGRQLRSYVTQMPRRAGVPISFVSGPRPALRRRQSVTDPLFTLRECATLLSLAHNTDFFPAANRFEDPSAYIEGMIETGRIAGGFLAEFSSAVLRRAALDDEGAAQIRNPVFSDRSAAQDPSFSLAEIARGMVDLAQDGGLERIGRPDGLDEHVRGLLRRMQVALAAMFGTREAEFPRL